MYVTKAVPPPSRSRALPGCVGRRGARLFAEMRFADNGQWLESLVDEPAGETCLVIAGGGGIFGSRTGSNDSVPTCAKVSRQLVADYSYYISVFLPSEFNWGEQLFQAIQFTWSYRSYGWCRRPIGKRVEEFLGLPRNFEGGSEYYSVYSPISHPGSAPDEVTISSGTNKTDEPIPVAFFYGKSDWMPFRAAKLISEKVARHSQRDVPVLLLNHSGHQMFLDNPRGFVDGIRMLVP